MVLETTSKRTFKIPLIVDGTEATIDVEVFLHSKGSFRFSFDYWSNLHKDPKKVFEALSLLVKNLPDEVSALAASPITPSTTYDIRS